MHSFDNFIHLTSQLYEKITDGDASLKTVLELVNSPSKVTKCYREEIDKIIYEELAFYDDDVSLLRKFDKVCFYEEAMGRFTCFYLFRIWQQNVPFSCEEIAKLIEAIFMGCIGYRLMDLCNDEKDAVREESRFLGYQMIQNHEQLLIDVFPSKEAFDIIKRHASIYYQAEYLEKKNKWKTCPFSGENLYKIGRKTSPLFAVIELIMLRQQTSQEKMAEMNQAFVYFAAAIQMIDDLHDAHEDLSYGFETPVMHGFFDEMGTNAVSEDNISKFLTSERLRVFFDTTQDFFEKARNIFLKYDESMMLILLESRLDCFYQQITFAKTA